MENVGKNKKKDKKEESKSKSKEFSSGKFFTNMQSLTKTDSEANPKPRKNMPTPADQLNSRKLKL